MKKLFFFAIVIVFTFVFLHEKNISIPDFSLWTQHADTALQNAYNKRLSNLQVKGEGVVTKILSDDRKGSRHQRFIIKLKSGQHLLVAHNIDLAHRVSGLRPGDEVKFYGEYEWNAKGGVLHWTHHDPGGRHIGGWLIHNGKTYQ